MKPFPWDIAMQFGLGTLRLPPESFWAMSPRELAAAYRARNGQNMPISRKNLEVMIKNFPDMESKNGRC